MFLHKKNLRTGNTKTVLVSSLSNVLSPYSRTSRRSHVLDVRLLLKSFFRLLISFEIKNENAKHKDKTGHMRILIGAF